jgi:3-isopropylmalate/(R)-2-methylmalate dehydratase small subunit
MEGMERIFEGPAYVVKDNIDTDQIIPAQYLMLVPTIPEEVEKLGSFALSGLPEKDYPVRFVESGKTKTSFPILVAGKNFGCGSSREHAPIALGAAGCKVVVAASYARIFFRNCVATGALYPCESYERLCDVVHTGDWVEVDLREGVLRHGSRSYRLRPLGDLAPVIEAGGIFAYARKVGMIPQRIGA